MDENQSEVRKKEVLRMAVMARPDKKPFIVSADKAREFTQKKMPKESWSEISRISKEFDRNNLKEG